MQRSSVMAVTERGDLELTCFNKSAGAWPRRTLRNAIGRGGNTINDSRQALLVIYQLPAFTVDPQFVPPPEVTVKKWQDSGHLS
jgi:hypothetical protein